MGNDVQATEGAAGLLESLSDEQKSAVTAPPGNVLVSAGAGTGKTRTLVARIAHLISSGVEPSSIVAVSFTNKAAREIRERLVATLGDQACSIRVGTFHSVAAGLLRRWWPQAGLESARFVIVDDEESKILVGEAMVACGLYPAFVLEPGSDPDDPAVKRARDKWERERQWMAKAATQQIARWKAWGLDPAAVDAGMGEARPQEQRVHARVYHAYQEELRRRNMLDFGDLVLSAVRVLEAHPEALEAESEAIRHLLVDEGQDVNATQLSFARMLSSFHGSIFVVGDDDQSIMGFQASFPQAMAAMAGTGATVRTLTINRRCTDETLAAANEVVNWNRRKGEPLKRLVSGRSGVPVELLAYDTQVQEAHRISLRIKDLMASGTSADAICVMVRSVWAMKDIEEAFIRDRIPYEMVGGSLMERDEVRDLVSYLRLAVNPRDDLAFRRIANRPTRGLGPSAVEAIMQTGRGDIPFHEACLRTASSTELRLKQSTRQSIAGLGRILEWIANDMSAGRRTASILATLVEDLGYREWLKKTSKTDRQLDRAVHGVEFLGRFAEDEDDPAIFIQNATLMGETDLVFGGRSAAVRLSTIHGAKGLEFDRVFLPSWDPAVFPSPRAVRDGRPADPWNLAPGGGIAEERRLAHVALTRAKICAYVSYPEWRIDYDKSRSNAGPSSMVAEAALELSPSPDFAKLAAAAKRHAKERGGRKGFGGR